MYKIRIYFPLVNKFLDLKSPHEAVYSCGPATKSWCPSHSNSTMHHHFPKKFSQEKRQAQPQFTHKNKQCAPASSAAASQLCRFAAAT